MNTKSKYNTDEYIGKKYNSLKILEYLPSNDDRNTMMEPAYLCQCDCGNLTIKRVRQVLNGMAKACDECNKAKKVKSKYNTDEYIGKKFGALEVQEFIPASDSRNKEKAPAYLCKCNCGNIVIKKASHVVNGTVGSCGKCHESRSKYADKSFIGKKFGNLEVVDIGHNGVENTFICNCDCGRSNNIEFSASAVVNGYRRMCSICGKETSQKHLTTKRYSEELLNSVVGKRYGKLVIKEVYKSAEGYTMAKCDCDCGTKDHEVLLSNILGDIGTRACGKCRIAPNHKYDNPEYIGKTFNYLTVTDIIKEDGKTYWKCSCSLCGHGIVTAVAHHIASGNTKSCGCMQSYGESVIEKALQSRNINYKKQVTFKGLTGIRGGVLRFDFGIYNDKDELLGLIEYDGEQHFTDYNETYYITEYELFNNVNIVKENDKIKNEFCKNNNIQLVRLNGTITEKIFFEKMSEACKS